MATRDQQLRRAAQARAAVTAFLGSHDSAATTNVIREYLDSQGIVMTSGDVDNLILRMHTNGLVGRVPAKDGVHKHAYVRPGVVKALDKAGPKPKAGHSTKPQITVTEHRVIIELNTIKITVEV